MRISVVTAVLDRASVVAGCLRSVLEQSHPDVEHVIIDGGSRDGTLDVIRANDSRVGRLISEPDGGLYEAINKGIAAATGDVVGILGADDVYAAPTTLARVVEAFEATGVESCFGDLVYVGADGRRVVRTWRSSPFRPGLFLRGWMPPHTTFFVRRDVYAKLGGYDPRLRIAADYELMLRYLERARVSSTYLPEVLVRMRVGGASNAPRNLLRKSAEDCLALLKNGYLSAPLVVACKNLRKIPQLLPRWGA
ncbi:MAG: glycosyltransferase [Planctomycetes bacterium]|nr:glycosyltransferase [Planctomycetota bacterium]